MKGEYTEDEVRAIYEILRDNEKYDAIEKVAKGEMYLMDLEKDQEIAYLLENLLMEYVRRNAPVSAATGGYTGEWSNDGRLAFLHQKELVLNAEDT